MAPGRRRGAGKGSAAAAARHQWKPGDLVLAKVKGYPAWPATVSEPQKWGYSHDWRKVLVYFFGTYQIAFCNPSDVEAFTKEKQSSLLIKRQGKGADFVRAVDEIIEMAEKMNKGSHEDEAELGDDRIISDAGDLQVTSSCISNTNIKASPCLKLPSLCETQADPLIKLDSYIPVGSTDPKVEPAEPLDTDILSEEPILGDMGPNQTEQFPFLAGKFSRKRSRNTSVQTSNLSRNILSARHRRTLSSSEDLEPRKPAISLVEDDADGNFLPLCLTGFGSKTGNHIACKLSGELDQKDTDSPVITQRMKLRSKMDVNNCDKYPCNSCVSLSYSSTAFVADESSSDSRSLTAIKEEGTCTFGAGYVSTTGKNELSEIIGESSDKVSEVSSMLPLSDSEKSKGYLAQNDSIVKSAVLRKRRNPNKKRSSLDTLESSLSVKDVHLITGCKVSRLGSPDTCFKASELCPTINGDEHLPLVKRARVRMGKPSKDDNAQCTSLDDTYKGEAEDLGSIPSLTVMSRSDDNHVAVSSVLESITSSSLPNDNFKPKGNDACFPWKVKKYHLIGSVDSEAALPPSKRLHRALEAMSANVAEAAETSVEVQMVDHQQVSEVRSGEFDAENPTHNPIVDGSVETPTEAMLHKHHYRVGDACDVPSRSEPADLPIETNCEENKNDCIVKNQDDLPHEDITETGDKGEKNLDGSFCSETHETCSFSESKLSSTSLQGGSVDSSSPKQHGSAGSLLLGGGGSTLAADIVEKNRSCVSFSSELFGNAQSPKVQPVGQCQSEHSVVQEENSILLEKGNGDTSLIIARADDEGCTSSRKLGNDFMSLKPQIEEVADLTDRNEGRNDLKLTTRAKSADLDSELMPTRDLLAATQSKLYLSRSGSLMHHSPLVEGRTGHYFASDQSPSDKINPCEASYRLASATPDDGKLHVGNSVSRSPEANFHHTLNVEDRALEPRPTYGQKSLDRHSESAKSSSALKSFEALLFTLTRTKDSIGRATRVAIDCAKYSVATEVVDVLLRNLESEPSLHRKVDLFFLVDSIIQCSRGQKGIAGDSYSSAVQAVLPRLLSAAAPPGNAARENRKQCLKVLRLWMERKTLPESVVRRHMQELDTMSESSIIPRRQLRTERPLNDPLREMEGMLVDEYGSNTSFHISGFTMPRLLEDEEELSASDEKRIAAPSPLEACRNLEESKGTTKTSLEKRRHILEDVDGELEMEDVSPCQTDVAACDVSRRENTMPSISQFDKCHPLPTDQPPLPVEIPPSPPPLPSSPPPPTMQQPFPPPLPVPSSISHSFTEPESHLCTHKNNYQVQLPQQFVQQQAMGSVGSSHLEAVPHSCPGYMDPQIRMPNIAPFGRPGPYSGSQSIQLTTQAGNIIQPMVGPQLPNKNFHLPPPTCAVSNQFSFLQCEPQRLQSWPEGSTASFQGRCQLMHPRPRESFCGDMGRMINGQDQMDGGCRFAATTNSGPYKTEHAHGHASFYGPHEHRNQWQSLPLVGLDYHQNSPNFNHPPVQRQISGVGSTPAPSVWRPS